MGLRFGAGRRFRVLPKSITGKTVDGEVVCYVFVPFLVIRFELVKFSPVKTLLGQVREIEGQRVLAFRSASSREGVYAATYSFGAMVRS